MILMPIKLYNTLTRKKENFKPIKDAFTFRLLQNDVVTPFDPIKLRNDIKNIRMGTLTNIYSDDEIKAFLEIAEKGIAQKEVIKSNPLFRIMMRNENSAQKIMNHIVVPQNTTLLKALEETV